MPASLGGVGVVIRPATPDDLMFTVRSHCRDLPHGLFPLMGPRFMTRWHATFLSSAHAVGLVAAATDDGTPVGFLLGAVDQTRLVQDVLHTHRLPLLATGLLALLRRPRLLAHFVRTRGLAYGRRLLATSVASRVSARTGSSGTAGEEAAGSTGPGVAVVTAVAVDPAWRGQGVGEALIRVLLDRARAAGAPEAQLTTVAGPEGAGAFYARLGWQHLEDHVTRDGLMMSTFRHPLGCESTGTAQ